VGLGGERHARPNRARHLKEGPGFGDALRRAGEQAGRREEGEGGREGGRIKLSGLTCVSSNLARLV